MKSTIFLLISFCLHLIHCPINAAINIRSTFFTINEGLADNQVHHIFQDSKGFIWMSTLNGLNRYDGYSFITFRPQKGDRISLADRHVSEVSEDQHGFLWIKTSPELFSCYDLRRNCFVDFTGNGEYKDKYTDFLHTSNGDTWLWHKQNGCRKVMFRNGKFSSVTYKKENGKLPGKQINQILEDNNGHVWICTESGVLKVSGDQTELQARELPVISALISNGQIFFLTAQSDIYRQDLNKGEAQFIINLSGKSTPFKTTTCFSFQDYWVIVTPQKSIVFHLPTLTTVSNPVFDMPGVRHRWDNAGNLWLFDQQGRLRYINAKTGRAKDFNVIKSADNLLYDSLTWFRPMQDSRGLLWITTYDNGLFIYDPKTDEMVHHLYEEEKLNRINTNILSYIMEDHSGSIWISTAVSGAICLSVASDGASHIYPQSNQIINQETTIRMLARMNNGEIWMGNQKGDVYKYDASLQKKLRTENYAASIYKVTEDTEGKLWIGSRGEGVCIDGRWYQHQPGDATSLSHNRIFDIFHDYRGRGWLATFGGGLDLAIRKSDGSYTFRHFLTGNLSRQEVRVITSDKNNWMWVGTDDGVCVFHPDSIIRNPQHYYCYTYNNDRLPGNEIKSIFYDSRGRIWLGMMGEGISMCIPEKKYDNLQFTHYTTAEGLINNMVQSIIEDREGKLWITTGYGISRFNTDSGQFENFLFDNSMPGNMYNEKSVLLLDDGRLLFGTGNGSVIIDPSKIQTSHSIPNVTLTNLKINGISVSPGDEGSPLTRTLSYTETLRLKHFQNSLAIEFSTLDYPTLNGTQYTYKLDGFDKEWSTASPLNFAAYKNLPPGNYTLHLKACNAVGTWSEKETVLQITIVPPFWKTTWAYLIYISLLLAATYIAFRTIHRFNTLRNRIQVENQLTEYKLVFFTNISHEFRTPLTLIQGALEKIESMKNLPKEMNYSIQIMEKSTQRMLRLINQLLEFRKMQNKKLSLALEETDVIPFLRNIYTSFSDTAEKKKMQFSFVPSVDSHYLFIDKDKLDKIVYNLLSNAFKYTPNGGKVTFSVIVDHNSDKLIMTIADSGIGIPKEKQPQLFSRFMQSNFSGDSMGIGLHLTHELVSIHKGSIIFHENNGGGSVFIISLPLADSVYSEKDFRLPSPFATDDFLPETSIVSSSPIKDEDTPTPINKKTILIIEDDMDVRDFLEKELSTYFEVLSEPDGTAGLERARACDADLILCDVLMPGLTGYEVTRQLKNDFDTSHIPIILLTAMSTTENQLEGVESGADAYVTKPFSLKLLLARIFQLINQREKLRKKFISNPGITELAISSDPDKKFLDKFHAILEENMNQSELTAEDFAAKMNLGRTSFFRKVRGVTGYSPNEYIRILRIKKAAELLLDGSYNVSEVSYQVGFSHPFYFSRCFKEQFGVPPSVYIKNGGKISDNTEDIIGPT